MEISQWIQEYGFFILELIGFVMNLVYLYFVIRQRSIAWIWSIGACALFVFVCYVNQLYLQTGLYIFYILIAIYGLIQWKKNLQFEVNRMAKNQHILFILGSLFVGLLFGLIFSTYTDQHLPYLDGLITAFAVGTTFLIVSKHRENWLYWILINTASMYLYFDQKLYLLTTMSLILGIVAVRGYFAWRQTEAETIKF